MMNCILPLVLHDKDPLNTRCTEFGKKHLLVRSDTKKLCPKGKVQKYSLIRQTKRCKSLVFYYWDHLSPFTVGRGV